MEWSTFISVQKSSEAGTLRTLHAMYIHKIVISRSVVCSVVGGQMARRIKRSILFDWVRLYY